MRKFSYIMLLAVLLSLVIPSMAFAQEAVEANGGGMQNFAELVFGSGMVKWFIDGGWAMWPIIIVALYGLAYIIWKFIALIYARINLNNFLDKVLPLVKNKKYKEAVELAKNTRGPVAAIIYAGLLKAEGGIPSVEKAIENAAMIEMSYMEKGFIELSTTITLAPMLGFLGTVSGMISAFDAIAAARAVDATIVASGIKIALITTQFGLIVAIPVQFFNNIFTTMVDGLVIDMQKATEKVIEAML
ncbi:MAG: MotA/TolQ/ExbB proton channel family protein [Candidatus Cloacimonetes bacterium]|nr:MotA/TolQ/ExbB proton channel family protein [Candidatus Cloacimonadota bacterium]MCB5286891.1 MotA/TolQ/ExbB proton channel family protein [Candidatus Cloacimonadota bacterium]MCK9185384.1 MotA/TolQ/ExbB proton channel family protein [Candidatus Cloacimonadota bacterium]MCK9584709.1 MotA/TolQ/ExbB proton channel family protein [Candidatus Cloacimonadota bacterium]MDY0229212.1 MotA/TolQ/ExbB proton channel family protein [Candidatus Cloacimonadaceae bacterium]